MTEQTPILSVQGLCAGYRGHTVLRDISFALAPGEILCVAGESGCGKSTLLRALMGADDAAEVTAGTVIPPPDLLRAGAAINRKIRLAGAGIPVL